MVAYLFYDPAVLSSEAAGLYIDSIKLFAPEIGTATAINFFSSVHEDLMRISSLRVVALPTAIILDGNNRVLLRTVGELPDSTDIAALLKIRED